MAFEGHPIVIDLAIFCQREDLVTARIGQDWAVPVHKIVQSAQFRNQLISRAQI